MSYRTSKWATKLQNNFSYSLAFAKYKCLVCGLLTYTWICGSYNNFVILFFLEASKHPLSMFCVIYHPDLGCSWRLPFCTSMQHCYLRMLVPPIVHGLVLCLIGVRKPLSVLHIIGHLKPRKWPEKALKQLVLCGWRNHTDWLVKGKLDLHIQLLDKTHSVDTAMWTLNWLVCMAFYDAHKFLWDFQGNTQMLRV